MLSIRQLQAIADRLAKRMKREGQIGLDETVEVRRGELGHPPKSDYAHMHMGGDPAWKRGTICLAKDGSEFGTVARAEVHLAHELAHFASSRHGTKAFLAAQAIALPRSAVAAEARRKGLIPHAHRWAAASVAAGVNPAGKALLWERCRGCADTRKAMYERMKE